MIALDAITNGALVEAVTSMEVVDLGHDWFVGMPVAPVHAPYVFTLARRHADTPRDDGTGTANEVVLLSGHTGTHIDAFGHAAADDQLHGGLSAGETTTGGALKALGVETVAPIVCRGVLLDVAAVHGVECLPSAYEVTVGDLERACARAGTEIAAGDAVLIRTGWATRWPDQARFVCAGEGTPGPGAAAARWLAERDVRLGGSDTLTFELVSPAANERPVHALFLVERGIHIIEALNLETLAAKGVGAFAFVASPLRLVGATGSPIRPLALLPGPTNGGRR